MGNNKVDRHRIDIAVRFLETEMILREAIIDHLESMWGKEWEEVLFRKHSVLAGKLNRQRKKYDEQAALFAFTMLGELQNFILDEWDLFFEIFQPADITKFSSQNSASEVAKYQFNENLARIRRIRNIAFHANPVEVSETDLDTAWKASESIRGEIARWRNESFEESLYPRRHDKPGIQAPATAFPLLDDISTRHFTGRSSELQQLEALVLNRPDMTRIAILGGPGTGKSALAKYFAEQNEHRFADGVLGLSIDEPDPETVIRLFLRGIKKTIEPKETLRPSSLWRENFAHKEMLIILDNADDVAVAKLNFEAEKSVLIVTTRNREVITELGIQQDSIIELTRMKRDESLALLRKFVDSSDRRFIDEPLAGRRIAELLDDLPIALEQIGKLLQNQTWTSLSELEARLQKELSKVVLGQNDPARAAFELSLQRINENEKRLLISLGACPQGGFSLEAAQTASGQTNIESSLGHLINRSLLRGDPRKRISFHSLVRQFARELAADSGILEEAEQRLIQHFSDQVIDFQNLPDEEQNIHIEQLETNFELILMTAHWRAKKGKFDRTFWRGLRKLFDTRGYTIDADKLLRQYVALAEEANEKELTAYYYRQLGKALYQGRNRRFYPEAEQMLKIGLDLETKRNDQIAMGKALTSLGTVIARREKSRLPEAIDYQEQALVIAASLAGLSSPIYTGTFTLNAANLDGISKEHLESLTVSLNTLGHTHSRADEHQKANYYHQQAVIVAEVMNDPQQEVISLGHLCGSLIDEGKYGEVIEYARRALELIETKNINNPRALRSSLTHLGTAYQKTNQHRKAVRYFERALTTSRKMNDLRVTVFALARLQGALLKDGQKNRALKVARERLSLAEKLSDAKAIINQAILGLVSASRSAKSRAGDEVLEDAYRCLWLAEEYGDHRSRYQARKLLSQTLLRRDQNVEALSQANLLIGELESQASSEKVNSMRASIESIRYRCLWKLGRIEEAWHAFWRAISLYESLRNPQEMGGLTFLKRDIGEVTERLNAYAQEIAQDGRSKELDQLEGLYKQACEIIDDDWQIFYAMGNFEEIRYEVIPSGPDAADKKRTHLDIAKDYYQKAISLSGKRNEKPKMALQMVSDRLEREQHKTREIGSVKIFLHERGYGFIARDSYRKRGALDDNKQESDLFVHSSEIRGIDSTSLEKGDRVTYFVVQAADSRLQARDVCQSPRETGRVKWFNNEKGFGFVERDEGPDVFVHKSEILNRNTLDEGQTVEFKTVEDLRKGLQAINIEVCD